MPDTRPGDGGRAGGDWRGRHPGDGTLRAYVDAELAPYARLRVFWHLRRCPRCRAALGEQLRLNRRTTALLARAAREVDLEEGWRRFLALSVGARAGRSARAMLGLRLEPWRLATTVLFACILAGGLVVASDWWRRESAMTRATTEHAAHAGSTHVRDACCWDLDGGGRGDDGVFTVSGVGEVVECVILYDDVDRNETLSAPDIIRYVSNRDRCGLPSTVALPRPASEVLPASRAATRALVLGA